MKILVINGSPKGEESTTYLMVEEFLKGARESGAECTHIVLSKMNIHPCIGCMTCWTKTPGICIFDDDRKNIDTTNCDILVYATPLYCANVSGMMKNFMDRGFSSLNPLMGFDANHEAIHPNKKVPPKLFVISNCGFPGLYHFDVLKSLFRQLAKMMQTEFIGEIYRDEGPLLSCYQDQKLDQAILGYKKLLQKAGKEIVQHLHLSQETIHELEKPPVPYEQYIDQHNEMAKNHFQ